MLAIVFSSYYNRPRGIAQVCSCCWTSFAAFNSNCPQMQVPDTRHQTIKRENNWDPVNNPSIQYPVFNPALIRVLNRVSLCGTYIQQKELCLSHVSFIITMQSKQCRSMEHILPSEQLSRWTSAIDNNFTIQLDESAAPVYISWVQHALTTHSNKIFLVNCGLNLAGKFAKSHWLYTKMARVMGVSHWSTHSEA